MKISPQKKVHDQAYLEFSRQKYSEFKAKHPFKSDQEIESMVKKQWQSTNRKTYTRGQRSSNSAEDGVIGQPMLSEVVQEEKQDPVKKKLEYVEEKAKRKAVKQQSSEELSSVKSSVKKSPIAPKKAISKSPKRKEYIQFLKFYNLKLHREHSNWSQNQITTILKLLWKKKKITDAKARKSIPIHTRTLKPLSGRKFFGDTKRKLYQMDAQNIQARWKVLPKQTRKYWSRLGAQRGRTITPVKSQSTTIKNSPGEKIRLEFSSSPVKITNPFSFMNAVM